MGIAGIPLYIEGNEQLDINNDSSLVMAENKDSCE